MRYLVLTTRPEDNRYGDTPQSYSFPRRYLSFFDPLHSGEEIMAVLYEPRRGQGRQAYVAWTTISSPPEPDPMDAELWIVRYAQEIRAFPHFVPKAVGGRDFEALLRDTPLVRHGPTLQGRSVRELSADDFLDILAAAQVLPEVIQVERRPGLPFERERRERVIHQLARDGSFRARVLRAYGFRCAVSGIGYHHFHRFGTGQLVDGAHLRPVAANGDDDTCNGLALTPSLHRLFDAGLFSLYYDDLNLRVSVSRDLLHLDLTPEGSTSRLPLLQGQAVRLPVDPELWPNPAALEYHRTAVYQR